MRSRKFLGRGFAWIIFVCRGACVRLGMSTKKDSHPIRCEDRELEIDQREFSNRTCTYEFIRTSTSSMQQEQVRKSRGYAWRYSYVDISCCVCVNALLHELAKVFLSTGELFVDPPVSCTTVRAHGITTTTRSVTNRELNRK